MAEHITFEQPTTCPFCGRENEAASPPGKDPTPPGDGDFNMCFSCGEWSIFDSTQVGGARKPVFAEYVIIATNPMCRKMRDAWVATMMVAATVTGRRR